MKPIRTLALLCLSLASPLLAAAAEPGIHIRFSHVSDDDTPKGQGALMFKRLVEERLGGAVTVEVFPNSTLFGDGDELQALRDGKVEMLATSLAKFDAYTPKLKVFDLPFLFDDRAALERFQKRPVGQQLLLSMQDSDIMGLAYWFNGMKLLSGRQPLREPGDARGLRFRIQPSRVLEAQFKTLGADTVRMPISQVAQALSKGEVTAVENPWSNLDTQRLYPHLPYITVTDHGPVSYMLITNATFWRKIPFNQRIKLDEIITEVTFAVNRQAEALNESSRARIVAAGTSQVITLTDAQKARWREAMRPLWQQFEGEIGADLITEAERANTHSR
ncbi:DctP family TRAP transporter solute-binding subunit [Stutzerimonas stutzeri]